MEIDPEDAKALAVLAFTGSLTDGLSGTLIENPDVGVKRAKCPACPHVIDVIGIGFGVEAPGDDAAVIMCCQCCVFLFVTPPGFTVISDEEFAKLPYETRTILERQRERIKSFRSLIC